MAQTTTYVQPNHRQPQPQQTQSVYANQSENEIEAIDQQFDEVLKFLAQTIDENSSNLGGSSGINGEMSSASPSSASLSATPNSDSNSDTGVIVHHHHHHHHHHNNQESSSIDGVKAKSSTTISNDRTSNGACSSSSNSSGIGEDLVHPDASIMMYTHQQMMMAAAVQLQLKQHEKVNGNGVVHGNSNKSTASNAANKRNSSDSAFMETVSMPSSVSLGGINRMGNGNTGGGGGVLGGGNDGTSVLPKSEIDLKQVGFHFFAELKKKSDFFEKNILFIHICKLKRIKRKRIKPSLFELRSRN